jgi:hypothetical protein
VKATIVIKIFYYFMSINALLPPTLNQQDHDEVFKMMDVGEFAELNDFLGEIDLHPISGVVDMSPDFNSSMISTTAAASLTAPVSPESMTQTTNNSVAAAPSLPVAPVLSASRVSPAPSVSSGGESSGDEGSVDQEQEHVPSTVVTKTSRSVQAKHLKNQKAATTAAPSVPEDAAQLKKNRRRYVRS